MEIRFDFNKEDIWNYCKHITFNISKYRLRMISNLVMVLTFVVLAGYISKFSLWEYFLYGAIFSVLYIYVLNVVLKSRMIKANSSKEGPLGEHLIEIGDNGIIEKLSEKESVHEWNEIFIIEEDKKYIYVKWNETSAHVIPKRAFESEKVKSEFFDNLLKLWNNGKHRPKKESKN